MSTPSNSAWLRAGLLSPQEILRRSGGEVLRAESRDAATGEPVEGGLRCPRIFGPPGSAQRRERFGHVQLAAPVVHPRFLSMRPSPLALLLGLCAGEVARRARGGVEALDAQLRAVDLEALEARLDAELKQARRPAKRRWLARRLELVRGLRRARVRPEWWVLRVLPVLPPALRPPGDRCNALYRRVLKCNAALKALPPRVPGAPPSAEELALRRAVTALFAGLSATASGVLRRRVLGKRLDFSARGPLRPDPTLRLDACRLPLEAVFSLYGPLLLKRLKDAGVARTEAEARALLVECGPAAREVIDALLRESPLVVAREDVRTHLDVVALEPRLGEGHGIGCHPALFERLGDGRHDRVGLYLPFSARARVEVRQRLSIARHFLSPVTGAPLLSPSKEAVYGLWYATRSRAGARGEGRVFASLDEVALAFEQGCVEIPSAITVRIEELGRRARVATTVGRVLLFRELEGQVLFSALNRTLHQRAVTEWLTSVFHASGGRAALALAERLWRWGQTRATEAGVSLAAEHFRSPQGKAGRIAKAEQEVHEMAQGYEGGLLTEGERYNKVVEIWAEATSDVARMVRDGGVEGEPLADLLTAGAGVELAAVQRLRGMIGPERELSGEAPEQPVRSSLSEGLSSHEFFRSALPGRAALGREAEWRPRLREFQRGLLGALGPVRVTQHDCGTRLGLTVGAETLEHRVRVGLVPRLIGRTAATEVRSLDGQQVLVRAGEGIDAAMASRLERWGVYRVRVRSVSTCEAQEGVCALCHGWEPTSARPVESGAAVGLQAARMLRTLAHPPQPVFFRRGEGGYRSWDYLPSAEVSVRGTVRHENILAEPREYFREKEVERVLVMLNEEGRVSVRDDEGMELESFRVRRGDRIRCEDGQRVEPGSSLLRSIYPDAELIVADLPPGGEGELPWHAESIAGWLPKPVRRGDVLAVVWERMSLSSLDVFGNALEALLRARRAPAHDRPLLADVDGSVQVVPIAGTARRRGGSKLFLHPEAGGPPRIHGVPHGRYLRVHSGEFVHRGEQLTDGDTTLHEVLRFLGHEVATMRFVTHLERFFLRNRTLVRVAWLELLARQLLGHVLIQDGGDTGLLPGQRVPWRMARRLDVQALQRGGRSATWEPVFTGLHTLARDGGPLKGALFGDGVGSWARAALSGQGEPSTSPLLRILAGLPPR